MHNLLQVTLFCFAAVSSVGIFVCGLPFEDNIEKLKNDDKASLAKLRSKRYTDQQISKDVSWCCDKGLDCCQRLLPACCVFNKPCCYENIDRLALCCIKDDYGCCRDLSKLRNICYGKKTNGRFQPCWVHIDNVCMKNKVLQDKHVCYKGFQWTLKK